MLLYKLFWDDFSGWYLEMIKPAYGAPIDPRTVDEAKGFFDALLRLLHPFMPFVTEEIWQDLAPRAAGESIMVARQPQADGQADEALLAPVVKKALPSADIAVDGSIRLGGVKLETQHILYDETLDFAAAAERAAFLTRCKLRVE